MILVSNSVCQSVAFWWQPSPERLLNLALKLEDLSKLRKRWLLLDLWAEFLAFGEFTVTSPLDLPSTSWSVIESSQLVNDGQLSWNEQVYQLPELIKVAAKRIQLHSERRGDGSAPAAVSLLCNDEYSDELFESQPLPDFWIDAFVNGRGCPSTAAILPHVVWSEHLIPVGPSA